MIFFPRYYKYLEHHWTEFGDGDELSNEMVTFLKHEHYKLQNSFAIPAEGLGVMNTALYAIETEVRTSRTLVKGYDVSLSFFSFSFPKTCAHGPQ